MRKSVKVAAGVVGAVIVVALVAPMFVPLNSYKGLIADKVKAGDRKGAMALLKKKGLPAGKLDKISKGIDKAPAMGAAHEKRDDWFISQYGSKSNPNEDLPGSDNGNCGPTSLTMVAKAFGKISPTAEQADAASAHPAARVAHQARTVVRARVRSPGTPRFTLTPPSAPRRRRTGPASFGCRPAGRRICRNREQPDREPGTIAPADRVR